MPTVLSIIALGVAFLAALIAVSAAYVARDAIEAARQAMPMASANLHNQTLHEQLGLVRHTLDEVCEKIEPLELVADSHGERLEALEGVGSPATSRDDDALRADVSFVAGALAAGPASATELALDLEWDRPRIDAAVAEAQRVGLIEQPAAANLSWALTEKGREVAA